MITISDVSTVWSYFYFVRCPEPSLAYKVEAIIIPILKKRKLRRVTIKQHGC